MIFLINRGLLRSFSVLMKTTFGAATAKTLCVDLFRKIQVLEVTAQYMKRNISRELRAYPLLENKITLKNVTKESEGKAKKKVITIIGDSMIKNLNSHEILTTDLLDHVKPAVCKKPDMLIIHTGTMIMERISIQ